MNWKPLTTFFLCLLLWNTDTRAQELTDLKAEELRGCVGISTDGTRMACVSFTGGRSHLEIKEINTRRLRRIFLLGSPENRLDATTTPAADLRKALKGTHEMGMVPLALGTLSKKGVFQVPHASCALTLPPDKDYVQTVSSDGLRPWLKRDGVKGEEGVRGPTQLLGVSVSKEYGLIFIVLRHETPERDAAVPEIKVLRLSDLTHRGECSPQKKRKSASPPSK